jgi:tetrahydromethanopterin S-methyltransferase subunit D
MKKQGLLLMIGYNSVILVLSVLLASGIDLFRISAVLSGVTIGTCLKLAHDPEHRKRHEHYFIIAASSVIVVLSILSIYGYYLPLFAAVLAAGVIGICIEILIHQAKK